MGKVGIRVCSWGHGFVELVALASDCGRSIASERREEPRLSESRLGLGLGCGKSITAETGAAALTAYPEEIFKLLGQVTIRGVV